MTRADALARIKVAMLLALGLSLAGATHAQTLTWLGVLDGYNESYAYEVSADGCTVFGVCTRYQGKYTAQRAFRWTPQTGLQEWGWPGYYSSISAASADGRRAVGTAFRVIHDSVNYQLRFIYHALMWTYPNQYEEITNPFGGERIRASDLSADGLVMVGSAQDSLGRTRAWRWANGVFTDLGDLGGGSSRAAAISPDGRVIVGTSVDAEGRERSCVWRDGLIAPLPTPVGLVDSWPVDVSSNGTVIVGTGFIRGGDWRAFIWQNMEQVRDLGTLGGRHSDGSAVSGDGRFVVGSSTVSDGYIVAFRWSEQTGMENLDEVYRALLGAGSYLEDALGISLDGRYIVGAGYQSGSGYTSQAFLLDTWRTGDTNGDGCIDDADLLNVLFAFGTAGTGYTRHEDINKDGVVNNADLLVVLLNFGQGC